MILNMVNEAVHAGARLKTASETVGLSIRTLERWDRQGIEGDDNRNGLRKEPANKLTQAEQNKVLNIVNSQKYRDVSPKQIVPRLADEGVYVASESSIYRLLRSQGQMTHRERSRPATSRRPREHTAVGPDQVWAWDITYLPGPIRGMFFYLYLILDVWSRKIVGASVHAEESSELASRLFVQTCNRMDLNPNGLVFHADNGAPMKGSTMLATLQWLGVIPSFSRPHVSNDNAFAEAIFRTLKYRPEYPYKAFASIEETQRWVECFVNWYNTEHRHSAIRYVTPDERHYGKEKAILDQRRQVYERARCSNPERWSGNIRNWEPVGAVRLNPERRSERPNK